MRRFVVAFSVQYLLGHFSWLALGLSGIVYTLGTTNAVLVIISKITFIGKGKGIGT